MDESQKKAVKAFADLLIERLGKSTVASIATKDNEALLKLATKLRAQVAGNAPSLKEITQVVNNVRAKEYAGTQKKNRS